MFLSRRILIFENAWKLLFLELFVVHFLYRPENERRNKPTQSSHKIQSNDASRKYLHRSKSDENLIDLLEFGEKHFEH